MDVSRRQFLGTSAAAVFVAGSMGRNVWGANDRVRIGVAGIRGRGNSVAGGLNQVDGTEIVALCDIDRNILEDRADEWEERNDGARPAAYEDIRDMIADDSVDVIALGTPNHWHSLPTMWGIEAGKDVFVEKPMSHNVWEGRQIVEAVKDKDVIVQHGTQRRSSRRWIRAMERMREGVIGDVYMGRGICFRERNSIGFEPISDPPDHINWTLFQGPVPEMAYHDNYVHYNWHWFFEFGNGEIGNQGVHQTDIGIWGIGKGLPTRVFSEGGRYGYEDQATTPNTQTSVFMWPDDTKFVFDVRGRYSFHEEGNNVANSFFGSDGWMMEGTFYDTDNNEIPDEGSEAEEAEERIAELTTGNHYEDFINAVRSRRKEDIHGTALDGHESSCICHLANISYQLKRELTFDPASELFVNDEEANNHFMRRREYRPGFEVTSYTG